jgi:hypothetical protein
MEKRFTYDAVFKRKVILCAADRKYTVSEARVPLWRSTAKLFSCLTNIKSFSGPRVDRCLCFRVYQRLRNKGLPVTREALMSKAKEWGRNS